MRWEVKQVKPKPKKVVIGIKGPNLGDTREVKYFAWLPKEMCGVIVWLESYTEVQIYKEVTHIERIPNNLVSVSPYPDDKGMGKMFYKNMFVKRLEWTLKEYILKKL